jgi:hypothetical protein
MRGARRAFASRANGRLGKGPRTEAGRQRRVDGVRCHGLSLSVLLDETVTPEIETLARKIVASEGRGPLGDAHLTIARRIAEAMIDLRRVRLAKRPLSVTLDADPASTGTLKALARLDRYERRALSRRKFAIREFAAAIAGIQSNQTHHPAVATPDLIRGAKDGPPRSFSKTFRRHRLGHFGRIT